MWIAELSITVFKQSPGGQLVLIFFFFFFFVFGSNIILFWPLVQHPSAQTQGTAFCSRLDSD